MIDCFFSVLIKCKVQHVIANLRKCFANAKVNAKFMQLSHTQLSPPMVYEHQIQSVSITFNNLAIEPTKLLVHVSSDSVSLNLALERRGKLWLALTTYLMQHLINLQLVFVYQSCVVIT